MKIKKGDSVIMLSGSQKGESGKVTATYPKEQTVVVEGINVRTKHKKQGSQSTDRSGIIKEEKPVPVAKVALVRPGDTKKATRVGYDFDKTGKKIRVARQAKNKEIK